MKTLAKMGRELDGMEHQLGQLRRDVRDGSEIGEIVAVQNFGATDIVEIEKEPPPAKGQKSFMVPMTRAAVLDWDETRLVISKDFADS